MWTKQQKRATGRVANRQTGQKNGQQTDTCEMRHQHAPWVIHSRVDNSEYRCECTQD